MHDLALSVVLSKGMPRLDGSTTVLEYRYGLLTIHYRSGVGALDVWCVQKGLVVDRFAGRPQLIRYVPGHWERMLMDAPKLTTVTHVGLHGIGVTVADFPITAVFVCRPADGSRV